MRRKTAGLFTPYLDIMGGGERHILSILQVLHDTGYNIELFWETDLSEEIRLKLNIAFERLTFRKNIRHMNFFEKAKYLAPLDWFFYVTDGSYFLSPAKKNAIFAMVPKKSLYKKTPLTILKTSNAHFISNSLFTKKWLNTWGISSSVIYPYISEEFFAHESPQKRPIILSVGRFFGHLHNPPHADLIQTFQRLRSVAPAFKLILAGGVKDEDREYYSSLVKTYASDSIIFRPNIPFSELKKLYAQATCLWHFAGFGIDENKHPEMVEHLGMTPLEAMASKCIPFCVNAGGPREIISSGENGFLFHSPEQLLTQTTHLIHNASQLHTMQLNAYRFAFDNFRYMVFKRSVINTLHLV